MSVISIAIPIMSVIALICIGSLLIREIRSGFDVTGNVYSAVTILLFLITNVTYISNKNLIILPIFLTLIFLAINRLMPDKGMKLNRHPRIGALELFSALSLWLGVVNIIQNPHVPASESFSRLLPGVYIFILGVCLVRGKVNWRVPLLAFLCGTLLVNSTAPFAASSWRPCDQFKCGPFGAIYIGPYSTENTAAMYCGFAILIALMVLAGLRRILVVLPLATVVFATESRTSQLALLIGLLVMIISIAISTRKSLRHKYIRYVRTALYLTTTLITAVGLHLVVSSDSTDFSNRGFTWMSGVAALGSDWKYGLGIDRWITYQQIGLVPPLFPHSQYLLLTFCGGIVSVVLLVIAVTMPIRTMTPSPRKSSLSFGLVTYISIIGIAEIYWNPSALDAGTTFVIVFILLFSSSNVTSLSSDRAQFDHLDPIADAQLR